MSEAFGALHTGKATAGARGSREAMACWVDGHEQVGALLVRAGAESGCWQGASVLHGGKGLMMRLDVRERPDDELEREAWGRT